MNKNHFRIILYLSFLLIIAGLCLAIKLSCELQEYETHFIVVMMTLCFIVGFGFVIALMEWNMTTGEENAAFLKNLEVSSLKRKQTMDVDKFFNSKKGCVSDDYLRGFAESTDFFVRNYLSEFTEGPTEHLFWEICRNEKHIPGGAVSKEYRKSQYRFFMLYCLMLEGGMSEEQFAKMASFCPDEGTRAMMAQMLYSDSLMQQMKENIKGIFDEAKREEES